MSKEYSIEDAISELWVNAPDAMERVIQFINEFREEKYDAVRAEKQRGRDPSWILGEMLAYQEMAANLQRPQELTIKPIKV